MPGCFPQTQIVGSNSGPHTCLANSLLTDTYTQLLNSHLQARQNHVPNDELNVRIIRFIHSILCYGRSAEQSIFLHVDKNDSTEIYLFELVVLLFLYYYGRQTVFNHIPRSKKNLLLFLWNIDKSGAKITVCLFFLLSFNVPHLDHGSFCFNGAGDQLRTRLDFKACVLKLQVLKIQIY